MRSFIDRELDELRQKQANRVMPRIGPLLDCWEGIPNDVRGAPELKEFGRHMERLFTAMDGGSLKV
jgi:hypothetical protein